MSSIRKEYPSHADYDIAVQYLSKFVNDPILSKGVAVRLKNGPGLLAYPGGFAKAYKIEAAGRTYALRVWLNEIGNAAHKYAVIAEYFRRNPLDYLVKDFQFNPDGILVNGQRYPFLRMEWVVGQSLVDFIDSNLKSPETLRAAAQSFLEMVRTLHAKQLAHGDLQSDNMMLGLKGKSVSIKLIDYDTLVVPALIGKPVSSTGLECYQHPNRGQSTLVTLRDDYFSELVIYLSLLAVAEHPDLWKRFPTKREKELLFVPSDFCAASPTPVFQRLYQVGGLVCTLAEKLWDFTSEATIDKLVPLENVLAEAQNPVRPPSTTSTGSKTGTNFEQVMKSLLNDRTRGAPLTNGNNPKPQPPRLTTPAAPPSEGSRPGEERDFELLAGLRIRMCWIPSGAFLIGSPTTEVGRGVDELQGQVRITQGFWMARQPCTQKVWKAVMLGNPSFFVGDQLPVETVTWNECQRFFTKLPRPGGGWSFQMPTEAQWEYACRAETTGPYYAHLDDAAWYIKNSDQRTHQPGGKNANQWGLQDMHGNVREWCRDAYHKQPPHGRNPENGQGENRVARGGSWCNVPSQVRAASRLGLTPDYKNSALGFRLTLCRFS